MQLSLRIALVCFALLAFCILPTHYHIAFRQGPVSLSRTMRSLQGRFSQSFDIRHRSTGPVWQSRFKAEWVGENAYLQQLIVYIHLNPIRAGLAGDPEFAQRFEDLDRTLAERAERESK